MAKPTENAVAEITPDQGPPAGFEKVGHEVDGFWNPEKGPVFGKLLEARYMGDQVAFVFKLERACAIIDKDKKEGTRQPGDVIGVWSSAQLRPLMDFGGCLVWIKRGEKKQALKGGRSMWPFDIQKKGTGTPLKAVKQAAVDDDDLPF